MTCKSCSWAPIKGSGDTWFVLLATFLISAGALMAGNLCQQVYGGGLWLWWYVIAGWVTTMGVVFTMRYLSGVWNTKRVIECAP